MLRDLQGFHLQLAPEIGRPVLSTDLLFFGLYFRLLRLVAPDIEDLYCDGSVFHPCTSAHGTISVFLKIILRYATL